MLVEVPLGNLFVPTDDYALVGSASADRLLGSQAVNNRSAEADPTKGVDWLDLTWDQCARRAIRKKSRGGRLIRTLLKLGTVLRHGDVLFEDSHLVVAVNLLPCEVLIAEPKSSIECASIAYKLGDLHVPMEISDSEMITLSDGPTQAAFHELGITSRTETRRFQPTLRSTTVMTLAHDFELFHTR